MIVTIKQIHSSLRKKVTPYIKAQGFTAVADLIFQKEPFKTAVGFTVQRQLSGFDIRATFTRTYDVIEQVWVGYRPIIGEDHQPAPITIGIERKHPEALPAIADIDGYATWFQEQYEGVIVPFFENTQDIRWLDRRWNADPAEHKDSLPIVTGLGLKFRQMIVARLAGNTAYEDICKTIRNDFDHMVAPDEYKQKRLTLFDRVYGDLKNVAPLSNPIMTG